MIVEFEVIEAVKDRLVNEVEAVGGRVYTDPKFPTNKQLWPCIIVNMPRVDYRHTGNAVGKRPRAGLPILTVTVADDGSKPDIARKLYEISQRIDDAVMGEPNLRREDGRSRVTDLTLEWSQLDTSRHAGNMMIARQQAYSLKYLVNETNSREITSR